MCFMKRWITSLMAMTVCFGGLRAAAGEEVRLAVDGKTDMVIVQPSEATPVDDYAARTLAKYLNQMTGAEFQVIDPADVGETAHCIFVGLSNPARKRLGVDDPLSELGDEEHVCRTQGEDIFLYGEGIHGQLWAVVEFLENSLGWRWYTPIDDPVVPSKPTIVLEPFNRKKGFSFKCRQMQPLFNREFYYLHGMNMGWELKKGPPVLVSKIPTTCFTHSLMSYIPPSPGNRYANRFEWQDKKDYFKTNPEFFTLNKQGKRVPNKQLCLSNPALRKELTKNVLKDIDHARGKGWGKMYVTISAADTPGHFCYCDGCRALEKKYQSAGGPIIDYAIELCDILQKERPGVMVRIDAYRRSQTQKPPVLSERETLPENMIVCFEPIEDQYFADWWNHRAPMVQDTFNDLLGWSKITHNMMAWLYPSPWGTGMYMPVGNVQRIVNNMRLMHYAGVRWFFADHPFILYRSGFSELQRYLMFKLLKDIDCDTDAVIRDFTDHHYGAAGELMRRYIAELEQCRIDMELPPGIGEASYAVTYKSRDFTDRTFPYLTVENIHRWQTYFDQMEQLAADQPKALLHVRTERRELDMATLWKWLDLVKKYPEYFKDYKHHVNRIRTTDAALRRDNPKVKGMSNAVIEKFVFDIKVGGMNPPLPAQFDGIDPARIKQFLPVRHKGRPRMVEDPAAAFGHASVVAAPRYPLRVVFFQFDRSKRAATREITKDDIVPGEYRLYELGEIEITPDCRITFLGNGQTYLQLGVHLYEPGAENKWRAYASIKFEGKTYGGKSETDQVLVDRVILVSISKDQFEEQ